MGRAVQNIDRYDVETLPPGLPTKLKRPEEKTIRSFKPWMIGADTIGTLLDNGWSLGICCRHCPRTIEMTPAALEEKFGAHRHLKLVDLLPKLECGVEKGCGSKDMVLFPWKVKNSPRPMRERQPPANCRFDAGPSLGLTGRREEAGP